MPKTKIDPLKKHLEKKGKSENEIKEISKKHEALYRRAENMKPVKTNKDSPLFKDASEWDEEDKRHNRGVYRQYSLPSRRFKARYDDIDWSQ